MIDPVTNRYAEALFNLARSKDALDPVSEDIRRLAEEFRSESVASFFFDARVSIDARRSKLDPLLSGMHELTQNFVGLLFDKRREDVLRNLGDAFRRCLLRASGAAEGVVESARPLGASEIQDLEAALGRRLQKSVKLENRIVPELIGGVRVIVESRMVDLSLAGRLDGLRKAMKEAPLPSLQDA